MPDPMKSFAPDAADQALHRDIADLIKRHLTPDTPQRVLAIAAQVVGQCLALQDQRTMTADRAMQVVIANIEIGNRGVIDRLSDTKGTA